MKTLRVCPVEEIAAPLDEVWSLVVEPSKLDLWWDAKLQRADPAGSMAPGQRIDAAGKGLFKRSHIGMAVKEIDHAEHRMTLVATFPLGLVDEATISCVPLGAGRCRVSFG